MSKVDDMMRLGGEIRVMIHNTKIDGPEIAKRLAELAALGRDAIGVDGDIDVTFDPTTARYCITLKRPHPRAKAGRLCASRYLFDGSPDMKQIPPVYLEVVRAINKLDGILTREERVNGRSNIL